MAAAEISLSPVYNLRASAGGDKAKLFGCSVPFVSDGVAHVVLNAWSDNRQGDRYIDNHFVAVPFHEENSSSSSSGSSSSGSSSPASSNDDSARSGDENAPGRAGGGGDGGPLRVGRVRSWCYNGTEPVKAIHALDPQCNTLLFAQGGHFCFATEQEENQGPSANGRQAQGPDDAGAAREAGGGSVGPGSRARPGGEVTLSMDVHVGKIADFRVNSVSRDIVSGGDRGHVHVFSFDPEMAGIPSMKVSKYVGCPVSSVRWHPGLPTLITWTTSKGHLQMLDIRDNRIVLNIPADDMMPIHTHEHLSEGVMAVGCDNGGLQLLDSRKISAFLTLHDPVAGAIRQILPFGGEDCLRDVGASGWAAFGCGGFSRYSVCADQMCGAAPSVVPSGINGVATGTAELALDATCRTAALNLDAGLFLASPSQGHQDGRFQEQQLCGISRHFSILTLSKNRPQSPAAGGERPSRQVRRS